MGFWRKFGQIALPVGALAATALTGGAAAPLLGMALGAGAGFGSSMLGGAGWKKSLIGAGIGGALGGVGGGALKGMGSAGKFLGSKGGQALLTGGSKFAGGLGGPVQSQVASQAPQYAAGPMPQGQGYLNPIGLQAQRRTQLAGMGTRDYA